MAEDSKSSNEIKNASENLSAFRKQIEATREIIRLVSKIEIDVRNSEALRKIAETNQTFNKIRRNIAITIGARDEAKSSIKNIKASISDITKKPYDAVIKIKDQTKGIIDGIKSNLLSLKNIVLDENSKKIFSATIGEAMKSEDSLTALKTNFQSESKAGKAFEWANRNSQETQFTSSQVTDSIIKLSSSGLDYEKFFKPLGNLATAKNKSIDDAIDAMTKLSGGNLKEASGDFAKLGITKDMWQKQGIKVDKDGVIQGDSKQAVDAAINIMDSNWKGAMKNRSNTASGQIKNIKEGLSGLGASLVGVNDNGEIEKGGVFDTFKQQLSNILPLLDKFKGSAAFKVIQDDLNKLVSGAGIKFSKFIEDLMKKPDKLKKEFNYLWPSIRSGVSAIISLGLAAASLVVKLRPLFDIMAGHPKTVIGLFAAFKIGIPIISSVVTAFQKFREIKENFTVLKNSIKMFFDGVQPLFKVFFKLIADHPVVAIIIGIIAIVVILYEAWKNNWGGIRDKTKEVIEFIKERIQGIRETLATVQENVGKFVDYILARWNDVTFAFSHPIDAIVNISETGSIKGKKKGNNALGTSYWQGDWTWVGEQGPELMKLPGGTQILDNRTSQNMIGGSLNVGKLADTIVVREDADIDRITDALAKKLTKVGFNCV